MTSSEIERQAKWLAQASLTVAIVKKQLNYDSREARVAPSTRQKFTNYLKKVIASAEAGQQHHGSGHQHHTHGRY